MDPILPLGLVPFVLDKLNPVLLSPEALDAQTIGIILRVLTFTALNVLDVAPEISKYAKLPPKVLAYSYHWYL